MRGVERGAFTQEIDIGLGEWGCCVWWRPQEGLRVGAGSGGEGLRVAGWWRVGGCNAVFGVGLLRRRF